MQKDERFSCLLTFLHLFSIKKGTEASESPSPLPIILLMYERRLITRDARKS
jgi:hypothetical protein